MLIRNELRLSLSLIPVIALAIFGDISCGEEPEIGKPLPWPAFLQGSVVTTADEPIAGATVTFNLYEIHQYKSGRWDEVIYSSEVQTDENGTFRIPTADLPLLTHHAFSINFSVTVDGYADGKKWITYELKDLLQAGKDIQVIVKLPPGRLVVGRCVDPSGSPVVGAVVKTLSDHMLTSSSNARWNPVETDKSGRFYLRVPDDGKVTINSWISHPDWAPQFVKVPLDTNLFRKDIVLNKGGILSGAVRTIDGKPAAGIVVVANSQFYGTLSFFAFHLNIAVKTDANGRYQLPPLDGAYRVFLTQAARNDNILGEEFVVSDQAPPLVIPQIVSLKAEDNQVLDFTEPPKITVSGRISWPNGNPVPNHEVRTYYIPGESRSEIFIVKTVTDENGRYSLEVPKGMPELLINVRSIRDADRKWHKAYTAEHVVIIRKNWTYTTIDNLGQSRAGIDWIMRERR